jgi:hypothetical protein
MHASQLQMVTSGSTRVWHQMYRFLRDFSVQQTSLSSKHDYYTCVDHVICIFIYIYQGAIRVHYITIYNHILSPKIPEHIA